MQKFSSHLLVFILSSLSLHALECRSSLFPLTMKRFLALSGAEELEKVCVVTNR